MRIIQRIIYAILIPVCIFVYLIEIPVHGIFCIFTGKFYEKYILINILLDKIFDLSE